MQVQLVIVEICIGVISILKIPKQVLQLSTTVT
jgi:hypothetical protein